MTGVTNAGKADILFSYFRSGAAVYLALVTNAVTPNPDTNLLGDLVEIKAGNGYPAGGIPLTMNATDFPFVNEDDLLDLAKVIMRPVQLTAVGGAIPPSGAGASFAVLLKTDPTPVSRKVITYWPLGSTPIVVNAGQTHTLQNGEVRAIEL